MPTIDWKNPSIWMNAGTTVVAVLGALLGQSWIAENPKAAGVLAAGVAAINALLHAYAGPRNTQT